MVGLITLCSTKSSTPVTAAHLRSYTRDRSQDAPQNPAPRRKWTRLSSEAKQAILQRYEAGETSTALATEYSVAKSTILNLLRSNNVVVRRQPLTPHQVSDAARLYESGLSLSEVAMKLKINQETMRMAVVKAGVVLREPCGGRQA